MTADVPADAGPDQARTVEEKIALLRRLFADAPEVGRTARGERSQQAGVGRLPEAAAAGGERRPGREQAGQGLRAGSGRSSTLLPTSQANDQLWHIAFNRLDNLNGGRRAGPASGTELRRDRIEERDRTGTRPIRRVTGAPPPTST